MTSDLLTAQAVAARLETRLLGRDCLVLSETDSTNTRIKREYFDRPTGFVLIAERQTAGRGRLGRTFVSPPGDGLYFYFLLRPDLPLSEIDCLTLAAAVAVCEAVERLCGLSPAIKWVNDVFLNDRKLCGILTESVVSSPDTPALVVVGIGVNLRFDRAAHPELDGIAGGLADLTEPPTRAALAAAILNAFEPLYDALCAGQKETLLAAYRMRLNCLGRAVTVHTPADTYPAVCESLDDTGALIVRTEDGETHALRAGEISIRF